AIPPGAAPAVRGERRSVPADRALSSSAYLLAKVNPSMEAVVLPYGESVRLQKTPDQLNISEVQRAVAYEHVHHCEAPCSRARRTLTDPSACQVRDLPEETQNLAVQRR